MASKSTLFGDIAMLAFIVLQCLDGALTYLGVHIWGIHIEANPLVAAAVSLVGVGGGLMAAKGFAVGLGMMLHLRQVHLVVAALSLFYAAVAIVPWALMFLRFQ
jgi:hypothetical protein